MGLRLFFAFVLRYGFTGSPVPCAENRGVPVIPGTSIAFNLGDPQRRFRPSERKKGGEWLLATPRQLIWPKPPNGPDSILFLLESPSLPAE